VASSARHRVVHVHSRVDSRVVARNISRVDRVCRAAFARDNKLFSPINTHVSNVNLLGHIF
jgi:hypothetical protein